MTDAPTVELRLPIGLRVLRRLPVPRKIGVLGRFYGESLARRGVAWVETSAGPGWKLDLRNHTHRWIVYGDYEGPGFIEWARGWIREDSVVVDSGANIGQVLLYLAPKIRSGRYIAVEPHPVARQWLEDCLSRYPQWKVSVQKFGLGERAGRASLAGQWGGDAAVGSHTELEFGSGEIEVRTLDDYAHQAGLAKIDLWKLDMEGAEESALRGAEALLSAQAIRALVLETGRERFGGMLDMLAKHKYRPHGWNGRPLARGDVSSHRNVLFIADSANRTR